MSALLRLPLLLPIMLRLPMHWLAVKLPKPPTIQQQESACNMKQQLQQQEQAAATAA
jgi:hypothetical protein